MVTIQLTKRQEKIVEMVKDAAPITSEQIARNLSLTRAALRPDLAILTMAGILQARPRVGYIFAGKSTRLLLAEELRRFRVKDFKSVPVVVPEGTSVYDSVVTMFMENVGTLTVVDAEGDLAGVVSRKDLLRITLGGVDMPKMPISVMMTRMPNIIVTTPEETVYMAAKKIADHDVDALPVVRAVYSSEEGEKMRVVGRITKTNITKLFVELAEG